MPLNVIGTIYYDGIQAVPFLATAIKFIPWLVLLVILKFYFNGTQNNQERVMHGKVVIVTVCLFSLASFAFRFLTGYRAELRV